MESSVESSICIRFLCRGGGGGRRRRSGACIRARSKEEEELTHHARRVLHKMMFSNSRPACD